MNALSLSLWGASQKLTASASLRAAMAVRIMVQAIGHVGVYEHKGPLIYTPKEGTPIFGNPKKGDPQSTLIMSASHRRTLNPKP